MTYEFQTLEADGKNNTKHKDFIQAWNDMYQWVSAKLKAGQLTHQVLETCIWIEMNSADRKAPIYFYDARDKAIQEFGWAPPKE